MELPLKCSVFEIHELVKLGAIPVDHGAKEIVRHVKSSYLYSMIPLLFDASLSGLSAAKTLADVNTHMNELYSKLIDYYCYDQK